MVTPTEHAFRPQIEGTPGSQASPFRILIVDDDPSLRRTFPHVLARPDRIFDECGTIGEAIARLEHEHYALILLDYRLPDANGLALLDWLSDHQRDEAVIIISGEDAIDAVTKAKLFTQRACVEVADEVVQILGGYGYMREYGVERALRDARLGPIGGGTDEVMKEILGRRLGL